MEAIVNAAFTVYCNVSPSKKQRFRRKRHNTQIPHIVYAMYTWLNKSTVLFNNVRRLSANMYV